MKDIIAILSSSAFGVIITLLFNWTQNRKNNTLSYITEERKEWRETIRNISSQIATCKFNKDVENDIKGYLIQLQMNINPYGKVSRGDYSKEGHIWQAIDDLKNSNNEDEFEKNKELLLMYLAWMLKVDWERTKGEVRGYSNAGIYIICHVILIVVLTIYYFGVLNLKDMITFLGIVLVSCSPIYIIKVFFLDDIKKIKYTRRFISIKEIINNRKKVERKINAMAIVVLIYIGIVAIVLFSSIADNIVDNVKCYEDINNEIYVDSNLNEYFFGGFEVKLEKEIGKEINVLNADYKEHDFVKELNYDKEIKLIVYQYVMLSNIMILGFLLVLMFVMIYYMLVDSVKGRKIGREIEKTKYYINNECFDDISNSILIIKKIIEKDSGIDYEENGKLLGVELQILEDMKDFFELEIANANVSVKSISEYERKNRIEYYLQVVKECIVKLENINDKKEAIKFLKEIKRELINLEQLMRNDFVIK